MDRPSISALAYLLVAATSDGDDEDTAETRGAIKNLTHTPVVFEIGCACDHGVRVLCVALLIKCGGLAIRLRYFLQRLTHDSASRKERARLSTFSSNAQTIPFDTTPLLSSGRCPRQTHESLREAASSGAERKARALFKHRRVIARWTAGAAKSGDLRRQHFKRAGGGNNGSSTTTEVVDRSDKEARLQNDHASPLLSLVSTERLGRHVVAAGAIPAGKLLLRESPFAWSLHPEFSAEFCAHCLHEVTIYSRM